MNSAAAMATHSRALPETVCYHCGEDVPPGLDCSLAINGELRAMCCPGCKAVAGLIAESGLERFYEQRTSFNRRPAQDDSALASRFTVYDDNALAEQFSNELPNGHIDTRLLLGGVSCAACTWLIETSLLRDPAIEAATLNLAQSRLDVRFDRARLPMSTLFAKVAALGYEVQPWQSSARREQARQEYRTDLRRLSIAGIGMMQVGMFAIALHAGDIQGISGEYQFLLRVCSLIVTSFVVVFSARDFFSSAWRHLTRGALVMDLPVALAIGGAFTASAIATVRSNGDVYFDSVVMFTFLLLLARFVEKRLRYRDTLLWQDAEQALPDAVQRWNGESWDTVSRRDTGTGDQILVRSGDTLPVDGTVVRGQSAVREDSFNGESIPRAVVAGDRVFAGTVNTENTLEVQASGTYAQSRLAALQQSIDTARHDKPAITRLADRVASRFIAGVLAATVATALIWWQIDADRAFWVALSVLVISCPCALSLATPAALANAASLLRRMGVIVHGESALEAASAAGVALFDKTGTLTTGEFSIASIHLLDANISEQQIVAAGAALQVHSNHPVASAFAAVSPFGAVEDSRSVPGAGIAGYLRDFAGHSDVLHMGSLAFCRAVAPTTPEPPELPLYWVGLSAVGRPMAWIGLSDEVREESAAVVASLKKSGLRVEMLTGDSSARAGELATQLGFDQALTGASPDDKLKRVAELQANGELVMMIGDGLNDAPVLKRANASIAVSGATDLAKAQADFVVADGNLSKVLALHAVARQTQRVIVQNLVWALSYNLVGIPLAAFGLVPPWAAALGMSLSSVLVVLNAARLRRFQASDLPQSNR